MDSVTWYRHGDVIIVEGEIPKDAEISTDDWLMLGEATGHAHRLESLETATVFKTKNGDRFLRVVQPTALKHEEHHTRIIPPGTYEIRPTRETDHLSGVVRRVAD